MNKKRLIITSVISIFLVATLMIGSTYSVFTSSDIDENTNVYTTGNLNVTYTLSEDNINFTSIEPISLEDSSAVIPYRITVTNSGTVPYQFDLILNNTTAGESIDSQYIMTKVGYLEVKALSNCTDNKIKEDIILPAGESIDIDVRVWISDTISNTEIGKSFYAKLSIDGLGVYASSTDVDNSVLSLNYMNGFTSGTDYSYYRNDTYREKIKNASFVDYINLDNKVESWDMSVDQDGSIIAWVENNETEGYYNLYIGSERTIYAKSLKNFFQEMIQIESISFDNLDTGLTTNMLGMFSYSVALTTLDLSSFNTSNVTNMIGMFGGSSDNPMNITNIDLSSFDTSNVASMRAMFQNCINLTNIDVSKFDTSKVTDMSSMFKGCSTLINLDVSKFDTSKVTNMRGMFYECYNVLVLDVSKFDTSKVTNMLGMFYKCYNVLELDVSNFDTSKVTDMSYMFQNCENLTVLDVSNFDTSKVTDMSYMFWNCYNVLELDVSNFNTAKVTDMPGMFAGGEGKIMNLTTLDLSNFNTSNVTDMSLMFQNCENLTVLDVSNFDTSKVTNMLGMFWDCYNILELDVSNFNTSNVTNMKEMFGASDGKSMKITTLNLSGFDTSNVIDMSQMFQNCSDLSTTLTVKNANTTTYTDIFKGAATNTNATITVHYINNTADLIDSIIATKSENSNVIKGINLDQEQDA